MAHSFNKLWAAMAVSLITAASVVSADSVQGSDSGWYNGPFNGNVGGAYAQPVSDCCGSFSVSAEALFWRAREDGLAFARTIENSSGGGTTSLTAIEIENPHFNWDTGVRIGLVYAFTADNWDLAAYWTHLQTTAKGHVRSFGDTGTLASIWSGSDFDLGDSLSFVESKWRLKLDYADFEIGREFCVCSSVTFRPFVGVRAAWIKQKYRVFGETEVSEGFRNIDNIDLFTKFDGAGLRGGFGSQWNWGCGLSVYGSAAASILYGEVHSHTTESNRVFEGSTAVFDQGRQRDNRHGTRYTADAALGVRWQHCLCDNYLVTLQLGWEQHIFFDQNRFEILGSRHPQVQRGDLSVQGITFGAKLDF